MRGSENIPLALWCDGMDVYVVKALLIGLLSGYLSGQFGIGGGVITTPAIRLLLQRSPLIALGTPLPVIVPTALTGAYIYNRNGLVERRLILPLTLSGVVGVVLGSAATTLVSGHLLMLITAIIILLLGIRFLPRPGFLREHFRFHFLRGWRTTDRWTLATQLIGFGCGFFSGFLGLGGGFLLVPALALIFGLEMKQAFGTSLVVIVAYALPGSVVHHLLHHVDLRLMLFLILGVVPGAYLGAKVAIRLSESLLRLLFGLFLISIAIFFACFEIACLVLGTDLISGLL